MNTQYHIFLRSSQLIISDNEAYCLSAEDGIACRLEGNKLDELLSVLETSHQLNKFYVYAAQPEEAMLQLGSLCTSIESAGGLVINESNEMLLIFRHKLWDLPKGKIEKGEERTAAAIREVNEECGINDLTIIAPLPCTYHIYHSQNKRVLKTTYWFAMGCPDQSTTPQTEEDIEIAKWIDPKDLKKYMKNMYASIAHLLKSETEHN